MVMGSHSQVDSRLVRTQLDKIVSSETFSRSDRLCEFLRFTVESAVEGRSGDLKEYTIALNVFHRPESYDPKIDSLVRVEASKLRAKLALYYQTEGRDDTVRIEIPKGSYVPAFHHTLRALPPVLNRRFLFGTTAAVAAVSLIFLIAYLANIPRPVSRPAGTLAIAVLPFLDLSPSKDKEYLCDGLTEELITSLADLPALQIISRTSAFLYKRNATDIRRVAEELNVQAVLEGSLRVDGSRIRVISQLISARDGFHLWTYTYDQEVAQMPNSLRRIAGALARRFRMDLKTTRRALTLPPSRSEEAWRHYIRADQLRVREPLKAVEFYRSAVAADPNYSLAWAGLAMALMTAVDWGEARLTDVLPKAAEAADRALAAGATFAESHLAAAHVKVSHKQDWAGAERAFRRAIELDPTYLEARLDYAYRVLMPTGQFTEAVNELSRALALYPDSNLLLNQLANAYIKARQYGKAIEPLQASQGISQNQPAAWVFLGMAETGLGQYEEALQRFHAAASLRRTPWVISHLGYTYAKLGRTDEARKAVAELEEKLEGKPACDYEAATVHAALGNTEAAFAALDRAVASQPLEMIWIKVDYRFDGLRADPRFGRLLRKMRLE
jgi:TolB-like protein/Flp pilus assembly protein TadD